MATSDAMEDFVLDNSSKSLKITIISFAMDHHARDARQSLPDLPQSNVEPTNDAPAPPMMIAAMVPVVLVDGNGQPASSFTTPPRPAPTHAGPVPWNTGAPHDGTSRTGPDPVFHGDRDNRNMPVVVLPIPAVVLPVPAVSVRSVDGFSPTVDLPATSPPRAARGPALPPTIRVGSAGDIGAPTPGPAPRPSSTTAARSPADTAFCSDTVLPPVTTEFTVLTTSASTASNLAPSPSSRAAATYGSSTALAPPPPAGLSLAATLEHYVGNVSALALNTRVSSTSLASSRRAAAPARPRLVSGGAGGGDDLDDQAEAGLASPPLTRPDAPLLRHDSPAQKEVPATLQRTLQSYTSKRAYADRHGDRKMGWRQWWRHRVRTLKADPRDQAWGYFDMLIRLIDFYCLISIPTLLAFLCDYSLSYTFQFIAFDVFFSSLWPCNYCGRGSTGTASS
ncbi:hypothetical protein AMAG_19973 [Allomyces macrogynus ATCC 38327]|uniref:Uncharacterized protein n=1 Tax=Allomyces macrogynus (strain ATCC 38327) TaxID=578462 RepID=A0A0L0T372_ALLM3|nr:hypothetical protein AMAG_19973 [Allomyces macrogynus ATCC 38327]|eukprot:KNE69167.1 hypothetical protein AMAG_19973 [Allomyces macrogynus ATCC 38327]